MRQVSVGLFHHAPQRVTCDAGRQARLAAQIIDQAPNTWLAVLRDLAPVRIFRIKRRPPDMGLAVATATIDDFEIVADVPEFVWEMIEKTEAVSVAFLLPKLPEVPKTLTGGRDTIVVRVVHHPLAIALAEGAGPIISTSANLHGREPPQTMEEARDQLGEEVDYYIDYGKAPVQAPSTIIEPLANGDVRILREGVVTTDWLDNMLARRNG